MQPYRSSTANDHFHLHSILDMLQISSKGRALSIQEERVQATERQTLQTKDLQATISLVEVHNRDVHINLTLICRIFSFKISNPRHCNNYILTSKYLPRFRRRKNSIFFYDIIFQYRPNFENHLMIKYIYDNLYWSTNVDNLQDTVVLPDPQLDICHSNIQSSFPRYLLRQAENQSLQQKLSCNLLFKYMHQTHTHTCRTVINQYKIQCGTSQFINIILYHYKPIIDRTFNLLARRPQWRSQGYTHIIHQLWPGSRNIKLAGSFKTLSYQGIATYTLTSRKQPFKSMEICFLQGPTNQNPPRRHP